jgi:outer membrane lipoprotein-sorting protein
MKKRFFLSFTISFFMLLSGVGEAFVPQAPHLLHLVLKKIKQPVGIEAVQTRKILNYQDTEKGVVVLEERLIYRYPNQFRVEVVSDSLTRFSVESDGGFIQVADGMTVAHEKSPVDMYTDVLLYRDLDSLLNQLVLAGIDTTRVSFQRQNDTICYVIGRPGAKGKPFAGLWIEKESFLPIKYVVEKNGWMVEFFYRNWQQVSRTWYPNQVHIFLDHQLFATIDVNRIDLASDSPRSLFDIEHIEQLYPRQQRDALDEHSKQVDELDRRMEDFKKLYE